MKKTIIISMIVLMLTISIAIAKEWRTYGLAEITADGAAMTELCYIGYVEIITDGTNDAKVILYDNASAASGTVIFEGTVTGSCHFGGHEWTNPRRCANGIYVDITGTGASCIIGIAR
jgi:hypothetical protein